MPVYFCAPQPWHHGSNEKHHGLLRQYCPKGSDLSAHTAEDLAAAATQLNGRPRKTLDRSQLITCVATNHDFALDHELTGARLERVAVLVADELHDPVVAGRKVRDENRPRRPRGRKCSSSAGRPLGDGAVVGEALVRARPAIAVGVHVQDAAAVVADRRLGGTPVVTGVGSPTLSTVARAIIMALDRAGPQREPALQVDFQLCGPAPARHSGPDAERDQQRGDRTETEHAGTGLGQGVLRAATSGCAATTRRSVTTGRFVANRRVGHREHAVVVLAVGADPHVAAVLALELPRPVDPHSVVTRGNLTDVHVAVGIRGGLDDIFVRVDVAQHDPGVADGLAGIHGPVLVVVVRELGPQRTKAARNLRRVVSKGTIGVVAGVRREDAADDHPAERACRRRHLLGGDDRLGLTGTDRHALAGWEQIAPSGGQAADGRAAEVVLVTDLVTPGLDAGDRPAARVGQRDRDLGFVADRVDVLVERHRRAERLAVRPLRACGELHRLARLDVDARVGAIGVHEPSARERVADPVLTGRDAHEREPAVGVRGRLVVREGNPATRLDDDVRGGLARVLFTVVVLVGVDDAGDVALGRHDVDRAVVAAVGGIRPAVELDDPRYGQLAVTEVADLARDGERAGLTGGDLDARTVRPEVTPLLVGDLHVGEPPGRQLGVLGGLAADVRHGHGEGDRLVRLVARLTELDLAAQVRGGRPLLEEHGDGRAGVVVDPNREVALAVVQGPGAVEQPVVRPLGNTAERELAVHTAHSLGDLGTGLLAQQGDLDAGGRLTQVDLGVAVLVVDERRRVAADAAGHLRRVVTRGPSLFQPGFGAKSQSR